MHSLDLALQAGAVELNFRRLYLFACLVDPSMRVENVRVGKKKPKKKKKEKRRNYRTARSGSAKR